MHVLKISLWGHENICDPKRLDENKAGKPGLGSSWRSVPSSETVIGSGDDKDNVPHIRRW